MALVTAGSSVAASASSSSSGPQKVPTSLLRGKDANAKWKFAGKAVKMGVAFEGVRAELADESERTRLLKEVTRSAATQRAFRRFDSQSYLQKRRITLEPEHEGYESPRQALSSPRSLSKQKHHSRKSKNPRALGQKDVLEDNISQHLPDGYHLSQLLTTSSRNVDDMKHKLKENEGPTEKMRRRSSDWSWPQNDEVKISDEGANVPKMSEASRNELAATKFVQELREGFEELDALEELIQNNDGYEGLRPHFERRFEYHPRMKLLNDFVLSDPEALRNALVGDIPSSESPAGPTKDIFSPGSLKKVNFNRPKASKSMSAAMFERSVAKKGSVHPAMNSNPLSRSTVHLSHQTRSM